MFGLRLCGACLATLVFLSCTDEEALVTPDAPEAGADVAGPPDALSDTISLPETSPAPEVTEDTATPPDAETVTPDDDAERTDGPDLPAPDCPGGPGCECLSDEDCSDAPCIDTLDGRRCALVCDSQEACDSGWLCLEWEQDPDYSLCVDPLARLCQPCLTHQDCVPEDGGYEGEHLCLYAGDEGSFCGVPCDAEGCPAGYDCVAPDGIDDAPPQCVPEEGTHCPCLDVFITRGATTLCHIENEWGRCEAERLCDEPCPARTPAPESCNGIDDNCNGITDEDTEEECYPFYCDSDAGACHTACATLDDCQPGYVACTDGICVAEQGGRCTLDAGCATGFCVDGVCCESACEGLCESCAVDGLLGVCSAVPEGYDPRGDCPIDSESTCGRSGVCSGLRSCGLYPEGTVCSQPECVGETLIEAGECDGAGECLTIQHDCAPQLCVEGECLATCDGVDDCQAGYLCVDGTCMKDLGLQCAQGDECASGHCVDGVCCEAACDGVCEFCALEDHEGHCRAAPEGQDPRDDCPEDLVGSCNFSGVCSGERTCALYAEGTSCRAPRCHADDPTLQIDSECDGEGTCVELERSCAPFACDPANGRCVTGCEVSDDCQPGYTCQDGACLKSLGARCADGGECASGFCVSELCCDALCDGVCESCTTADNPGLCVPFAAGTDPRGECPVDPDNPCGNLGGCSGERSCRMMHAGYVCAEAECITDRISLAAGRCDGEGACVQETEVDCAPYYCDSSPEGGDCLASCTTNSDCVPGAFCQVGFCVRHDGAECRRDSECMSGFCADGLCCDSPCAGICERCDSPIAPGECRPVPAGEDPDNDCPAEPVQSCGRTGVCSGEGTCELHPAGAKCEEARCEADTAYGQAFCDGAGECVIESVTDCAPYRCDEEDGRCFVFCSTDAECQDGLACDSASAECLLTIGRSCIAGSQCESGFCVGGVCCDARCDGICESCTLDGSVGRCEPQPPGTPAPLECPAEPPSSCGRTGTCSGERSCALHPAGTECRAAECGFDAVAYHAHLCDGAGTCEPQGGDDCMPYSCNPSTVACRESCAHSSHCGGGYGCDLATGECFVQTGGPCDSDDDCLVGSCCDDICYDTLTNPAHCGECNRECLNPHGSTSCHAGECNPICDHRYASCDGDPATGCEQSLTTLEHCGECDIECSRPQAEVSCATGTCTTVGCELGYADCDGDTATGCETHIAPFTNTCDEAEDLGNTCGNTICSSWCLTGTSWSTHTTVTGRGGHWFRLRVQDRCNHCTGEITARFSLGVPSGVDYDLHVYEACGSHWASSTEGPGNDERVRVSRSANRWQDDSFDVWVEVRYVGGTSCEDWVLIVDGRGGGDC